MKKKKSRPGSHTILLFVQDFCCPGFHLPNFNPIAQDGQHKGIKKLALQGRIPDASFSPPLPHSTHCLPSSHKGEARPRLVPIS